MSNNTPAIDPTAEDWDEFEGASTDAGHALAKYQGGQVLVVVSVEPDDTRKAVEVTHSLDLEDADELAGAIRRAIYDLTDQDPEDWEDWDGLTFEDGGHVLVQYQSGTVRLAALDTEEATEAVLTLAAEHLGEFADALEAAAGDPQD